VQSALQQQPQQQQQQHLQLGYGRGHQAGRAVVGGRGLAGRGGHHHGAMMPPVSVGTTGSRAQQSGHYGEDGVDCGSCCWALLVRCIAC
jgi:hypothetical protein